MTDPSPSPVIELSSISKDYGTDVVQRVLFDISLVIERGEFVSLIGPSGSGKSTLLNIIGLLDQPTTGEVRLLGQETQALSDDALTDLRGREIGFVFQFHHLIGALSALENVMAPLAIQAGRTDSNSRGLALRALDLVGLGDRASDSPRKLSGGQQQRVAIARALVSNPAVVLADEPTGNLDTETSLSVFGSMRRLNQELSTAFVIVTHDTRIAERTDRVIELVDGRIARDRRRG